MDEVMFFSGCILVTMGIVSYGFLCVIKETRKIIIAKQDAIMQKLIEIKHR